MKPFLQTIGVIAFIMIVSFVITFTITFGVIGATPSDAMSSYDEGKIAATNNVPVYACPYRPSTSSYTSWRKGWIEGFVAKGSK